MWTTSRPELPPDKYGIEIGGGLGDFKGKAWRIGFMGESSRRNNVILLLAALADAMAVQGHRVDVGAGLLRQHWKYIMARLLSPKQWGMPNKAFPLFLNRSKWGRLYRYMSIGFPSMV